MSAADGRCQSVANEVACAGVGQGSAQSQRTDKEHQHIPGDVAESRFLINHAEQYHQQAAHQSNGPGSEVELRREYEEEDGRKEDNDAEFIHQRAELLGLLAGFPFFQSLDGDHRLFGGKLGTKEQCPERDNNENRPCSEGEVRGLDAHTGKAVGLHETGVLASHLNGCCQWEDAATGHADDHDREHILGAAVSGVIAQGSQQWTDDGINDHGAGNEVGEQDSQQDVAEIGHSEAATGHFHDGIAHAIHQRGAAEACGHHKHGSHQQGVDIGEAGQCTACINASGKVKCCQRDHGSEPHGDLVQHIADQRCRKDHHTDDHLSIHRFVFLS